MGLRLWCGGGDIGMTTHDNLEDACRGLFSPVSPSTAGSQHKRDVLEFESNKHMTLA
jgi:hypothetical protein